MGVMLKLLFFFPVYILPSQTFETRSYVERHFLNEDGSLNGSSITPDCGNGRIINFIAYSYQEWQCHFSDVCRVEHVEPFTPAAEFLLHKMCSGKTKCDSLSFPDRSSEQKERTNSVYLEYSCLDQARTFINMCEDGVTYFNETVYVTSDDTAELFSKCECFVNKDTFSLTVTDLRLTTHGDQCLSATVFVNSNEFACDAQKGGFGSVFHRGMIRSATNAFISLKFNSTPISPDRIFISLTPKVSAKISCEATESRTPSAKMVKQQTSKQKSDTDSSNIQSQEIISVAQQSPTTSYSTKLKDNISHHEIRTNYTPLAIGIGTALIILIFAFAFSEKIQRFKTRVLDCICTTNANQVPCSNDGQAPTDGISVNMSRSSQRAYPKTANTMDSVESDALMNHADTDHDKIQSPQDNDIETNDKIQSPQDNNIETNDKIQSPQDEDIETNFNSLNPTAKMVAEDQTNIKVPVCD